MVVLLISVICESAKELKKEVREIRNERQNEENYEELPNDQIVDIDTMLSDSISSKTDKLAQKFANDALKSLKMQETINKLTDIDASRNDLNKMSQLPAREHAIQKSKIKSNRSKARRHEDRKKRKRKRHKHGHRREGLKNRRPRWSKKRPAKVDYDSSNKQNAANVKIHVNELSNKSNEKRSKMLRKNVPDDSKSIVDNMTFINWDNLDVEDYIDLTQSTNSEIDSITNPIKMDRTKKQERSMKTITKDSKKKNLDDQDAQYGNYYNDVDESNEEQKLEEKRKNPRARSIRQSYTMSLPNQNSNDYLYGPDETEKNADFKYGNLRPNNFENHLSNSISLVPVQTNGDSINLHIGKEQNILTNELEPKKPYDSMILPMGQDQNLHPVKTNENFITGVSNFAFSKLGQNDKSRPLLVGQENMINTDPTILQSNENQYKLPIENDDTNLYNNYPFNSGQEEKLLYPIEDNLNYLNNYGSSLEKQDEKYMYSTVHNRPEDQLKDQFQLVNTNKNLENTIELKNPTKQYENTFVLPQDQQSLHYLPVHKNTYQGDRSLFINSSKAQNDKTSANLPGNTNINVDEPLRKISDISPSHKHVQPVERFPSPRDSEPEETWKQEDDTSNIMDQQIKERGLRKGFDNSKNSKKLDESAAEEEERLRREFTKRRKSAIAKNRYSVEEDVANMQRVNIAATVNETKEVADQILNRIIDELEEIKMDHSKDKNGEGFPCKLTGSWVTSKAGVRIDIKVMNHSIIVTLANLIPQPMHVGLINTTWNITGHAPFKRGGPFSLFAYDNRTKTLAAFVGSCRVCQGIDTIVGVWSVAREPRDCRNFQMATEIFNDIFRRTKLLTAIKEKKKAILQNMLMKNIQNTTSYRNVEKDENN